TEPYSAVTLDEAALNVNPFRVFTSLLRLEMIEDEGMRGEAEAILAKRRIYTPRDVTLIERHEQNGGLTDAEATEFV
ncbi:2-oxoadipate dioxygenase/decarboxylase family protein, partial [Rhizobium ruizarguesonis]